MTILTLLMTRFASLHMQDTGQYPINTEVSLQLNVSVKDVNKSYTDSYIVTMSEKNTESDFAL